MAVKDAVIKKRMAKLNKARSMGKRGKECG
jgi:hypothetical protein